MKYILRRFWKRFHQKFLENKKLRFASWWFDRDRSKYCWADCVMWAFSQYRFNPWKIDTSKGCELESKDHQCKACYCGIWQDGICDPEPPIAFEVTKEELQQAVDELPF